MSGPSRGPGAPWTPERAVGAELARALVESQFPRLAPARVEPLGQGWDNTVFAVNGAWVFRFPRRQIAVPLLEAELRILPALPDLPLPVPVPELRGAPSEPFPWPFAGYRLLPAASCARCTPSRRRMQGPIRCSVSRQRGCARRLANACASWASRRPASSTRRCARRARPRWCTATCTRARCWWTRPEPSAASSTGAMPAPRRSGLRPGHRAHAAASARTGRVPRGVRRRRWRDLGARPPARPSSRRRPGRLREALPGRTAAARSAAVHRVLAHLLSTARIRLRTLEVAHT